MNKKFLIPVVDLEVQDQDGKPVIQTKRVVEVDEEGKRFVRFGNQIVYINEEDDE